MNWVLVAAICQCVSLIALVAHLFTTNARIRILVERVRDLEMELGSIAFRRMASPRKFSPTASLPLYDGPCGFRFDDPSTHAENCNCPACR